MDHIFTSLDIAQYYNLSTVKSWIEWNSKILHSNGVCPAVFSGEVSEQKADAYVNFGRWLAICPNCKNSMYACPQEKICFCTNCGNSGTGKAMTADFPADREAIEALLLARPVLSNERELNPLVRVIQEVPLIPGLYRNWNGENVQDLRKQNEIAGLS